MGISSAYANADGQIALRLVAAQDRQRKGKSKAKQGQGDKGDQ